MFAWIQPIVRYGICGLQRVGVRYGPDAARKGVTDLDASATTWTRTCADSVNVRNPGMRALVVTNMYPSPHGPRWAVSSATRSRRCGASTTSTSSCTRSTPAAPRRTSTPARDLKRRFKGRRFDVVHAHFGLTAWPALAVERRQAARHAARQRRLPPALAQDHDAGPAAGWTSSACRPPASPPRSRAPAAGRTIAILPCGIDVDRFRPLDRRAAREQLGLDPGGRYLLFPYGPARAVKRVDRARELAAAGDGVELLTLGDVATHEVPLWMNAANAVVCPADWETFGLAASRRSRATSRCSPARPARTPRRCAGSPARSAPNGT